MQKTYSVAEGFRVRRSLCPKPSKPKTLKAFEVLGGLRRLRCFPVALIGLLKVVRRAFCRRVDRALGAIGFGVSLWTPDPRA